MMIISDPLRSFAEKMPTDWQLLSFGSMLAEPVRNGIYKTKEFHGRGTRVVNMGELFGFDYISGQEMKRVELNAAEEKKSCLLDGDLLFARRSLVFEGAGKVSLIVQPAEQLTFESSIIRARPDREVAEPRFLFYLFTSPLGRSIIASIATRTAVSGIRGSDLIQLGLPLPPLPTQQRIAAILSAYDELIENSQRRIKTLEAMARALYREWFVHFRFPGSENHPRVTSALGEIPQGWDVRKLGDLVEFKKGKKPASVFESEEVGLQRHLLIDALRGGSSREFVSPDKLISTTSVDTIMVMDGSGSSDVFIGHEGVIGSTLGRYRTKGDVEIGPFWLFLFFSSHLAEIKSKNVGSAIPHANKDFINGMDVVIGPEDVMQAFEKAVEPMFDLIRSLNNRAYTLRATRDLLLPRLLSGQINLEATN